MEINFTEEILLTESQIDKDKLILRNVAVLNKISKNNRQYSDQALTEAVSVFANTPSYFNHPSGRRDVRDLLGQFTEMRRVGDSIRGDLQLIENSKWLLDVAERTPKAVGFSINAVGKTRKEGNLEIVESIVKATSIDLVADPATTKSIFEGVEKQMTLEENLKKSQEDNKLLEENLKKLQEENKTLLEKSKRADLKESATKKLPQYAVTDMFLETLVKAENAEILIEERLQLIESVKKSIIVKGSPAPQQFDKFELENIKEALKG